MGDFACHDPLDGLAERGADEFHVGFGFFELALDVVEAAGEEEVVGADEHGGEGVDEAEGSPVLGVEPGFLAELAAGGGEGFLAGLDAAADDFEGGAADGVLPFANQPDVAVVFEGEGAGAVFDFDALVGGFSTVRQGDVVFAELDEAPLIDGAGGTEADGVKHQLPVCDGCVQ